MAVEITPNRVRKIRKTMGLSQAQFAKKYELGVRSVQSWEQGVRVPGPGARALLRLLWVSIKQT